MCMAAGRRAKSGQDGWDQMTRLGTSKEGVELCHHAVCGELWKVVEPGRNGAVRVGDGQESIEAWDRA